MKGIINLSIYTFLLFTIVFQSVNAQQNISAASISGQTTDQANAAVSGATISLKNLETNQTQTATTDENGRFRFGFVLVGNYELTADEKGFSAIRRQITVTIGQILEIPLQLSVEGVSATVDVASNVKLIETARTQVASTILPQDIENLPLNGRNYLDLALLLPGVSKTNTGNVQRFAETSAVPGTGISVVGQRNLNNSFIVDGSSANDDAALLAGTTYSQEVIREFQVVTSGGVAEFGRASSGFVNILTRSGTNEFRGNVYGFLRDDRLDARNPLANRKDPLTQTQYGGSIGGKIIKDRTFYFANFEQTRRNDSSVITISPASVETINNRLDAVGYRGSRLETGVVPSGFDTTNIFARLDHQLNSINAFSATYSFYDIEAENSRSVGGLNAISRGTNLDNKDQTFNVQNITTIGSNSINEFRFQYRNSRLDAPVNDEIGPAVNISGVASFGTATFSPLARDIDLFQISDNFSTNIGDHLIKFGGDFTHNKVEIFFPGSVQGVYIFSSLNNFLNGNFLQFQQTFGNPTTEQKIPTYGLFVQDEWRVFRNLTLNFGLRYDIQDLEEPIEADTENFAPRFGFAYSPKEKTVVRGSFGLYFDRVPLRATANAIQRDGVNFLTAIIQPTSPDAPVFPNVLSGRPTNLAVRPSVTRIDPNIENSYSYQGNLQIEHALPFDSSVSVGYIYLRSLHLIRSRNINVPTCSDASQNLCRPNPDFGNISFTEGSGNSEYNGLVFSFQKQTKDRAGIRISYTYSKVIDDAGNFFFSSPQDNFNLRDDRGLSDNDQRHRLTVSGTLNGPKAKGNSLWRQAFGGFAFSYIYTYSSHLPFNIQTGNDRNGDTNNNDRPLGVGRNTGRGFNFSSLDLRLSRRLVFNEKYSLEFIAESFNTFNRANFSVPNATFGTGTTPSPNFGRPTAAFDPRQIQFGFKFGF